MVAGAPPHVTPERPDRLSLAAPRTPMEGGLPGMAAPFGGEEFVMLGGVLSRLTATDVFALFPAVSTAVPLILWFLPSVFTATGELQDVTPLVASEQVKFTVTSELFQPAAFG